MAKDSSKKLTRHINATSVVTSDVLNRLYGGEYGQNDSVASDDSLVAGHVHDGLHADGHAQKVKLTNGDHVTGQLSHANLGGSSGTTPAVQKKNIQSYSEDIYGTPGFDHDLAVPEYEEVDGVKQYYLDLSNLRGEVFLRGAQPGWLQAGVSSLQTSISSSGLTITLNGTWIAVSKIGNITFVNQSFSFLAAVPSPGTYYLFVDGTNGQLKASATIPDITTAGDIPIGRFTHNGTSITSATDLRFFTKDDNRKILYTVRADGAAGDANAEGAFMSIDAALAWAAAYGNTGVSSKTEIHLRGSVVVNSTINLQIDYLTIHGEGDAELVTGTSLSPMINLNGKTSIGFNDINFRCEHANSIAIQDTSSLLYDLKIFRSTFNGSVKWDRAVNLTSTVVSQCQILESRIYSKIVGINIPNAQSCSIIRCDMRNYGVGTTAGLVIGALNTAPTYGGSKIDQVYTQDFTTGIYIGSNGTAVTNCYPYQCGVGIHVGVGSSEIDLSQNIIDSDNEASSKGIYITGDDSSVSKNVRRISLLNNKIKNSALYGIHIVGYTRDVKITGNEISCYAGDGLEPTALGIYIDNTSAGNSEDIHISGNTISRSSAGMVLSGDKNVRATGTFTVVNYANLTAGVDTVTIGGTTLTAVASSPSTGQFLIGASNNATATNLASAINNQANGIYDFKAHAAASSATVTLYAAEDGEHGNEVTTTSSDPTAITVSGAKLTGGAINNIRNVIITNNSISKVGHSQNGIPSPLTIQGLGSTGIVASHAQNIKIESNQISNLGIIIDNSGDPFFPPDDSDVYSNGIVLWNCRQATCQNNDIFNLASNGSGFSQGIYVLASDTGIENTFNFESSVFSIRDNNISWEPRDELQELASMPGYFGISVLCDDSLDLAGSNVKFSRLDISNNNIYNTYFSSITMIASGVNAFLSGVSVNHNKLSPLQITTNGGGVFIYSSDNDLKDLNITGNTIKVERSNNGSNSPYVNLGGIYIQTQDSGTASSIENVVISGNIIYSKYSAISLRCSAEAANLTISNNIVNMSGAGSTATLVTRPLLISTGELGSKISYVKNINITGNIFSGGDGCRISSKFGTAINGVSVIGNTFDGTSNNTNPADLGSPQFDGFYAALSIHAQESATPGIGDIIDGIVISGNTFKSSRREAIAITKGNTDSTRSVREISISNNTFESCGAASPTTLDVPAVILVGLISDTADGLSDVQVSGNSFYNCKARNNDDQGALVANIASIINLLAIGTAYIQNCSVSKNSFTSTVVGANTVSAPSLLTTICSAISVTSYTTLRNIDLSSNVIDDLAVTTLCDPSSGIATAIASVSIQDSENISINQNQINNAIISTAATDQDSWSAILLPMAITSIASCNVNENIITNSAVTNLHTDAAATAHGGIIVVTSSTINEVTSISGNNGSDVVLTKDNTDGAEKIASIYVNSGTSVGRLGIVNNSFYDAPDPANDATGISINSAAILESIISGNQLVASSAQAGNGIHLVSTAAAQTVISNNTVKNYDYSIYSDSNASIGFSINGNSLIGTTGGMQFAGPLGSPSVSATTINGNTIYSGTYGILSSVACSLVECVANSIASATGISLTVASSNISISNNIMDISVDGMVIDGASNSTFIGNAISGSSGNGMRFTAAATSCSASDNTITVDTYPIQISSSSSNLTISGNSLYSTSSHAISVSGAASYLTITGNSSDSAAPSAACGYIISGSLSNSSITGNSINAYLYGINFTSSSTFAYNTISSNNVKLDTTDGVVTSVGFVFTNRTLSRTTLTGNTVQSDNAATGGTPTSPATGTCISNSGTTTSGANSWDDWAYNSGTNRVLVWNADGYTAATAELTVKTTPITTGVTITIDGLNLTATNGASRTSGSNDFDSNAGSGVNGIRNEIIAAINDPINQFYNFCFSYANGSGKVVVKLRQPGRSGNSIAVTTSNSAQLEFSAATFAGGTDKPLNS
jgi:hypothetical protein